MFGVEIAAGTARQMTYSNMSQHQQQTDKYDNNHESPHPHSRPNMSRGTNTKYGFAIGKRG
jgi:hypothetical protein